MLKIGNLTLENNLMLAPLAGITDMIFRVYAKRYGCGLVFSEMINSNSVLHGGVKTLRKMDLHPEEQPVGIQLAGDDPHIMADAARMAYNAGAKILNINMGCPSQSVTKTKAGCALMNDPLLVQKIIRAVHKATPLPLTIKIRLGWDDLHMNYLEIAKIAEGEGCVGIIMHARTKVDRFRGEARWAKIKKLKENTSMVVIGNGDVTDAFKAKAMLEETGCDGVMIGRGAQGRPWLFKQILGMQNKENVFEPTPHYIKNQILNHLEWSLERYGHPEGIILMRKHFAWYSQGLPHSNVFRKNIQTILDLSQIHEMIHQYFDTLEVTKAA
ncbi:MAG: tRNA dihydrouridine synthase DusB [Deltaproteobacteria bacterium]|nr:tRNA dihydrouridine synthase DusB [Deltaproteobacteria bacterium]